MTRDQWARVKEIVAGALARPEARRSAYVSATCGADGALQAQVQSLLDAATEAADLYESPTLRVDSRGDPVVRPGPDRIVRKG